MSLADNQLWDWNSHWFKAAQSWTGHIQTQRDHTDKVTLNAGFSSCYYTGFKKKSDNSFLSCKAKQMDRFQWSKNSPQIPYREALHCSSLKYQTFFVMLILTVQPTMNCKDTIPLQTAKTLPHFPKDDYPTSPCWTFTFFIILLLSRAFCIHTYRNM